VIAFLRRLRLTIYLPQIGEHHVGLGYHWRVPGAQQPPILDGGERGILQIELWIAHAEWRDYDPRTDALPSKEQG
jgi:hypothetical protein